jgi:hypothetical protein
MKIEQHSTQRGGILIAGAIISVIFEWFGHSSATIMPIFVGLAGLHGVAIDDAT